MAAAPAMSYTLDLVREAQPGDERVEAHGATMFVEAKAVLFLLGTEMDFEQDAAPHRLRLPQPQPGGILRLRRERQLEAGGAGRGLIPPSYAAAVDADFS